MRYLIVCLMFAVVVSCKTDSASKTDDNSNVVNTTNSNQNNANNAQPTAPKVTQGNLRREGDPEPKQSATSSKTNYNSAGIPDACDLLSKETIAKYVNQPAESIFLNDGSSPQNPMARACFFKWDGSAIPNAGVMVQLQKNQVADEVPEYLTLLVQSKKNQGEIDPATGSKVLYKDWPGHGEDGAYSTDVGKYMWRVGDDWVFMVAFNTVLPPKSQKVAADAFAKEVMSRMSF